MLRYAHEDHLELRRTDLRTGIGADLLLQMVQPLYCRRHLVLADLDLDRGPSPVGELDDDKSARRSASSARPATASGASAKSRSASSNAGRNESRSTGAIERRAPSLLASTALPSLPLFSICRRFRRGGLRTRETGSWLNCAFANRHNPVSPAPRKIRRQFGKNGSARAEIDEIVGYSEKVAAAGAIRRPTPT